MEEKRMGIQAGSQREETVIKEITAHDRKKIVGDRMKVFV
jgi:hypothetical protein